MPAGRPCASRSSSNSGKRKSASSHLARPSTRGGDADRGLVEIAAASRRQGSQLRRLDAQGVASPRVVATNDLRDEGPPVVEGVEVAGTAQLEGLVEPGLQMPMAAFDRAVLMGLDLEAGTRLLRVGSMPSSTQRAS